MPNYIKFFVQNHKLFYLQTLEIYVGTKSTKSKNNRKKINVVWQFIVKNILYKNRKYDH
jgi:hypothetical protein